MRTKLLIPLFAAMFFIFTVYGQEGAVIFKKNCAVCHSIGKGKLVGPDLKGTNSKYDVKWMTQWIKSSQTMVKNKDPKAVQIYNDNNHLVMPDQVLTDNEITTLLVYIADETVRLEQIAIAPAPQQTSVETSVSSRSTSNASTSITSQNIICILITFILFLTVIIIVMSKVIKDLTESHKNDLNHKSIT